MTRIVIDDRDAQEGFRAMVDKQMPFALAGTLNGVMLDAQRAELRRINERFHVTDQGFARRMVKIRKFATKRDPVGEIAMDGKGADIYAKFEDGGIKTPIDGLTVAIPEEVKRRRDTTINYNQRPRALIDAKQAFLIRLYGGAGRGLILQRYGRGHRRTRVLYLLEPRVVIRPRLSFVETIRATFSERYARQFQVNFDNAMKTAR